jgi:hypothetical protein
MLFASFSQGGKTRCMEEVASHAQEIDDDVVVIYVTFHDWSNLEDDEQGDSLQALCQRIAFVASRERTGDEDLETAYEAFRKQAYFVEPDDIAKWIAGHRVILMVEELNKMYDLDNSRSFEARRFAKFIRGYFLDTPNRYFLFSSHRLTTGRKFDSFMTSSIFSNRGVIPWALPIIDDLRLACKHLNPFLNRAALAAYFGLNPALIYTHSNYNYAIGEKWKDAITRYETTTPIYERDEQFPHFSAPSFPERLTKFRKIYIYS